MPATALGLLRRASAVAALLLSALAALWLAFGSYHFQLDLQGVMVLTFKLPDATGAPEGSPQLEQLRRAARAHVARNLADGELPLALSFSRDLARLEIAVRDENDASQLVRRLGPPDFRLLAVRDDQPPLFEPDRQTLEAKLRARGSVAPGTRVLIQQERGSADSFFAAYVADERPIAAAADLLEARVDDSSPFSLGVAVKFKPEAGDRLAAYTAGHIGQRIAMVLDDEVLMAPVIKSKVGADVLIAAPRDAPHRVADLAARLQSAARPPLVLLERSAVRSHAGAIRIVASVLGLLAVVAWILAMVFGQRVTAAAVAAGLSAFAIGLAATLVLGGVFMVSYVPTLCGLALVASLTVLLLLWRGGPAERLGGRLAVSWPGLLLLAASFLPSFWVASFIRGFAKGAAMAAVFAAWPVLVATILAVMAAAPGSRARLEGQGY